MSERAFKIGVMGSARGNHSEEVLEKARMVGKSIAESNCILLYGATIGITLEAAKAARQANGFVLGISPASNEKEHVEKYNMPLDACSTVVFTGFGLCGRNIVLVRSCDAVIIVSGRVGTMVEFGTAYAEKKVVGILTETGGVADKAKELEEMFEGKFNTKIIYERDSKQLVEKVLAELQQQKH